jgi:hypothetical protein
MGYTADHFIDIQKLELEPHFRDYLSNAFAPLGVYLNFWQPKLTAGENRSLQVLMVNDESRPVNGNLTLALESANGEQVARQSIKFSLAALGAETYNVDFLVPSMTGNFLLKAIAETRDKGFGGSTQSRRRVMLVEKSRNTD